MKQDMIIPLQCLTCLWYHRTIEVCGCRDSKYYGETTAPAHYCRYWEEKSW